MIFHFQICSKCCCLRDEMLTTKSSQFLFDPMEGNDVDDHPTQVPVVKPEVCPIAIKFCIGENL
jgi:hypothetical protein